jgi:hypothetical protein
MNEQLLKEADTLCDTLKSKMWHTANQKNKKFYDRLEIIYLKATNRYERRYRKWVELQQ